MNKLKQEQNEFERRKAEEMAKLEKFKLEEMKKLKKEKKQVSTMLHNRVCRKYYLSLHLIE